MKRRHVASLATFISVIFCFCYVLICYAQIAHMNLSVNPKCSECFTHTRTNAGCVIYSDKKILLVRDRESKKFAFPGGRKTLGERSYQTAYRETLEETGLHTYIDNYITDFPKEEFCLFECNILSDFGKHDNEIIEMKYFSKDELKKLIDDGSDVRFIEELKYVYEHFDELERI